MAPLVRTGGSRHTGLAAPPHRNIQVKVLETKDNWFGVTYKEDKAAVVESFKKLIADGVYQEELYSDL